MATSHEFYLAPGGPVDRLQEKLGLRTVERERYGLRALIAAVVIWVPLTVIALLDPNPGADISFFQDIAAHVRFLVIVPILIVADGTIGHRSRMVVTELLSSGVVPDSEADRFERAARRGRRMLESWVGEAIIIALTAALVWIAIRSMLAEPTLFWFERMTPSGGNALSWSGWWYAVVATPISAFLMLRWLWRYTVWSWFLWRVSRLELHLTGSHPDRAGGLGFVCFHQSMFCMLMFAAGCAVSAALANRILYADATLQSYRFPLAVIVCALVLAGVAPLLVFSPRLVRAKREKWMTYSRFSSDYVWMFERKWLGKKEPDEDALGSGDIQSLADIGGSFQRLVDMKPVPIDRRLVLAFLFATLSPVLPLILTVMPLREIIQMFIKAMI